MSELKTLGSELSVFDPNNIDTTEIKKLSDQIPKDTNIDLAIAEKLAAVFLRTADRCSEILAKLFWYEHKKKADKQAAFSKAVLRAKEQNGRLPVSLAEHSARCDSEYMLANDEALAAEAIRRWFEGKHDSFLKAHQLMKERLRSEVKHQQASGFNTSGDYGEGDWK